MTPRDQIEAALFALRAKIEGMRKPLESGYNSFVVNPEIRSYNAACDQFLRLIDEMIRRG